MSLQNLSQRTVNRRYMPGPTADAFHRDDSLVRFLMGPVGTGKTSSCIMEVFLRALKQKPHQGVRKSRWLVVRNTMPQLQTTVLKSWYDWFPTQLCAFKYGIPITCNMRIGDIGDGTSVECEVIFYPLNNQDDVQMPKEVLDMCLQRVGRFPRQEEGGCSWSGVWAESNPPDDDSWIYDLFETERPKDYKIFKQPPAIMFDEQAQMWVGHPDAENVANIPTGYNYWLRQVAGKDAEWIKVFLEGKYGSVSGGMPVYGSNFDGSVHRSDVTLRPDRELPVVIGFDWGLNPAAIFTQLSRGGRLAVLAEVAPQDCDLIEFMDAFVMPTIHSRFAGCTFGGVGDPAGLGRNPLDKSTPFQTLGKYGLRVLPGFSNSLNTRIDAVKHFLNRRDGLVLDPSCTLLYKGFVSKYVFERVKGSNGHYKSTPAKDDYSHVHDGLQYAAMYYRHGAMKAKAVTQQPANILW
jgi:hypothetical protein